MKLLALDLGTKTGWSHSDGPSGTWDLSIRRDESGGMRLIRLRAKLDEIMEKAGVDVLVFEAARHAKPGMQGALVVLAEMQSVAKTWCHDNNVEYRGYSATEIKKHATGKGVASKDKVLEAARERWPDKRIESHDEADALFLLDLARKELGE